MNARCFTGRRKRNIQSRSWREVVGGTAASWSPAGERGVTFAAVDSARNCSATRFAEAEIDVVAPLAFSLAVVAAAWADVELDTIF
jgi:hypothetical protein